LRSKNVLLFDNFEKELILYSTKNAKNIPKLWNLFFGIILCRSCPQGTVPEAATKEAKEIMA
jgi:hypothetical protein